MIQQFDEVTTSGINDDKMLFWDYAKLHKISFNKFCRENETRRFDAFHYNFFFAKIDFKVKHFLEFEI